MGADKWNDTYYPTGSDAANVHKQWCVQCRLYVIEQPAPGEQQRMSRSCTGGAGLGSCTLAWMSCDCAAPLMRWSACCCPPPP